LTKHIVILTKHILSKSFYLFLFWIFTFHLSAQNYVITGKVSDAQTGEPIPFANVFLQKSQKGSTTDFDGYFKIEVATLEDTLVASYIGYQKRKKVIDINAQEQVLNFQLLSEDKQLEEVVVLAGENPAWDIMRNVLENKKKHDKNQLDFYEYESYSKIELAIDNISEKFSNKRAMKDMMAAIDTLGNITGEDGKPLIPMFISETISQYYYRGNPFAEKEFIKKTKITGVGVEDDSFVSQLIGSSFQNFNFYDNWILLVNKEFVSPLADGWKLYYEYYLMDSMYVGDYWCYKIDIFPKNDKDLAFEGTIWIDSETYALKQLDLSIGRNVNINFVEKVKVQQELEATETGVWLPAKTRILVDISELSDNSAGVLAKFYVSNKNFKTNEEHPPKFYRERFYIAEDAHISTNDYWETQRHDSLTTVEKETYAMIDSLQNVPIVKSYVEIISILTVGYKNLGKIDIGNYLYTYAFNNVEGNRFRIGFRTDESFSRKLVFDGYLAYGTLDEQFKYKAGLKYILTRNNWTEFGGYHKYDISQIAISEDGEEYPALFVAGTYFGDMASRKPYMRRESYAYIQSEIIKGVQQKVAFKTYNFTPLDVTNFQYYPEPERTDASPTIANQFTNSEFIFETRYAAQESFLQDGNKRLSLGTYYPIFTFRYALGVSNVFGSNFNYHKFSLGVEQYVNLGTFGRGTYQLKGSYTPSTLPYPLLFVHLGNETAFYNQLAYNMMNFGEFISDEFISLRYEHHFEGWIFNRIPLLRRLKLRSFAQFNAIYGRIRPANLATVPPNPMSNEVPFTTFEGHKPYVEVAYGVENILKVLQVHFVHRLTYLDRPNTRSFGIRFALKISL